MLSADPLILGAVYTEQDLGSDAHGDTFDITFAGGAVGSEITRIVIDGDQIENFGNVAGLSSGDVYFDTANPAGHETIGVDEAFPLRFDPIVDSTGAVKAGARVQGIVDDGSSLLVLQLEGFQAGDVLRFSIDVDEAEVVDPRRVSPFEVNLGSDPLTSGAEFQGSYLTAFVEAPHHHDAEATATFVNAYDPRFQQADPAGELQLPTDNQFSNRDRTAGALVQLEQEPLPVTIAGTVYYDRNQDLTQDIAAAEIGIAGVQLELWSQRPDGRYAAVTDTAGNTVVASTNLNGDYEFGVSLNLPPGVYQVRETQPVGYPISVGAVPGLVDGRPVGAEFSDNALSAIEVSKGGQNAVDFAFAESRPAEISGSVYHDRDNDGRRETGEEGISGALVELYESGTFVGVRTTDADGRYSFADLPAGEYSLVEIQPIRWFDGRETLGQVAQPGASPTIAGLVGADRFDTVTLIAEDVGRNYDFGERLGGIEGFVHDDPDGDCIFDQGETGISGVLITLIDQDGTRVSTRTDDQGHYEFNDLKMGVYTLVETQPESFHDGGLHIGVGGGGEASVPNTISGIQLGGGEIRLRNYNFCEQLGSLSGFVYHDRDNDGQREPTAGEEAIGGVSIELRDAAGQVTTAVTNDQGFYEFQGLSPGVYTVVELQPAGWLDGKDTPGRIGGVTVGVAGADRLEQIALVGDRTAGVDYNFGERLGSIEGFVHADPDRDCFFDQGEAGVSGVLITLTDQEGNRFTTRTDSAGHYRFNDLKRGEYTLVETQPDTFFDGGQSVGVGGGGDASIPNTISGIQLGDGGIRLRDYNFCEHLGALSGFVYHDRDDDGQREPLDREEAIAGVRLELRDAAGQTVLDRDGRPQVTLTDDRGRYEFTELSPAVYTIVEQQPQTWLDGKDTPGRIDGVSVGVSGADRLEQVALIGDQAIGVDYNFGERLGSLSGSVHVGFHEDCLIDSDSTPLEGVTIHLLDNRGGLLRTTTTDANGQYAFTDLQAGEYIVVESQPEGLFHGGQSAGSNGGDDAFQDVISQVVIADGAGRLTDYNFCELPPSTLSGYVFQDGDAIITEDGQPPENIQHFRDGIRTPDDRPLANVTLELRDGLTGVAIQSSEALPGEYPPGPLRATTDADGFYEFSGLRGGRSYAVYEIQPEGFVDGIDTAGTTSGLAINPGVGGLNPLALSQLVVDPGSDAIIRIPLPIGGASLNNNFSEVVVGTSVPPPEIPLPPPPTPRPAAPPPTPATPPEFPRGFRAPPTVIPIYGGGGAPLSWHLSIINAGEPRGDLESQGRPGAAWREVAVFDRVQWRGAHLNQGRWIAAMAEGRRAVEFESMVFGSTNAIAIAGDWDGDGVSEIGVFIEGQWFLDLNGNGRWDEEDLWARLGEKGDRPVVGDWDGDGKDDIGIYGPMWEGDPRAIRHEPGLPDVANGKLKPKNVPPNADEATDRERLLQQGAVGRTRADLIDHVFAFGKDGRHPIAGDFNGDGVDTIGMFSAGRWLIDADGDGRWDSDRDTEFIFGKAGDHPLVGDFDADGVDDIGVFRDGRWIIDSNHNRELDAHDRVFALGGSGDQPIVADWNGDGAADVGVYRDE